MKETLCRNSILLNSLNELSVELKKEKIDVFLLKGAALLELNISNHMVREMSDVDIYVLEKDFFIFKKILNRLNFQLMENSSSAFVKYLDNIPFPLIIDAHNYLEYVKNEEDICKGKIKIRENIYAMSIENIFIHTVTHSIFHHGFFDDKAKSDLEEIVSYVRKNNIEERFIENLFILSSHYGLTKMISKAINRAFDVKIKYKTSLKEKIISPLLSLSFKRHSAFNEYFLLLYYRPILSFKIFFNKEAMENRYNKADVFTYGKKIFRIILKMLGKDDRD